jgi:hypothetical protein
MYICNCKSVNHLEWHPTQIYDDGLCYYCGHYALKANEKTRRNAAAPKKPKTRRNGIDEFIRKREEIIGYSNKGLNMSQIAVIMDMGVKTVSAIKNLSGCYKRYKGKV